MNMKGIMRKLYLFYDCIGLIESAIYQRKVDKCKNFSCGRRKECSRIFVLLSEPLQELKTNMDDLLVAPSLCLLGNILSANAHFNEDYKLECSVQSDHMRRESEL